MHYGKAVLLAGPFIIGGYFAWMRKYAKNPDKYPFKQRYNKVRKLLLRLDHSFDVKYIVEGKEKLPKETYCLISNHLSAYDPLVLIDLLEEPCSFVAKKELENKPFAGKIIKGIDGLFLDRDDLKQSLRVMMKVEKELKEKKKNWIIFPEGTRNKDPLRLLKDFHHGTFRPAVKAEVPIVPVALYGTFRVLKRKPVYKQYPIHVKFLDPIYPEEYKDMTTQEIAAMCQDKIQQALSYELRSKDLAEMKKVDKNHKFNKIY